MNLLKLKLKEQGIVVLLLFMFAACNHWAGFSPEAEKGSGKRVSVKIGAINVAGGSQNETITRAAGGEKRIVGQPVIQDLGDGLFAEISVEEDVLALRDDEGTNLADDANYRVIVLDSEGKYVTHNDFTPQSDNKEVTLEENGNYTFICFSRNSSDELPTVNYTEGQELPDFSTGITDGELYWEGKTVEVSGDAGLSFLLKPRFAKVTLKLKGGSRTITSVDNNKISLNAGSSGSFNLKEGTFSSSTGNTVFTGWSQSQDEANTFKSEKITFIPQEKYTFSFAAEAISWQDGATTGKTTEGPIGSFKFTFAAGSSYTVTLTILRLPRFAGSNIYWDGSQLTFDPYGTNNDHAKYQGVYFKWGLLIGIAAGKNSESYTSGSTVLYKPTNTSASVGTARTWATTDDSDDAWSGSGWENIPYQNANMSTDETLFSQGTEGFTGFKGDICYYINKDYRMPTWLELDSLKSYHKAFTNGAISESKADGTYEVTTQYTTLAGIVFPASGYRDAYNSGTLNDVGSNGYYWSGSAGNGTDAACGLGFYYSNGDAGAINTNRSYGLPVRCVKN